MLKRYPKLFVLLLTIAAFLFSSAATFAKNEDAFDLAIIAIESNPSDLKVGQETSFAVTFQNVGEKSIEGDVAIVLLLQVTDETAEQVIGTCRQPMSSILSGLTADEIKTHDFGAECKIIFRSEEQHLVQAVIVDDGTSAEDAFPEVYLPLAGEAEGNNGNNGYKWNVTINPFESNLPDELGRLFAGLGMFFAIMAIMAVGTEVVIDSIKLLLGMKSKITSLEALERMEKLIPGQLATLGIDVASQKQFENLTQSIRSIVEPISETPDIVGKVSGGDFNAAFEHLEKLGVKADDIQELKNRLSSVTVRTEKIFDEQKKKVASWITSITTTLKDAKKILGLNADQQKSIDEFGKELSKIATTLDSLTFPTNRDQLIDLCKKYDILKTLLMHELYGFSSLATAAWLEKQRDELLKMSRYEMLASFDNFVKPQLEELDKFLDRNGGSLRTVLGIDAKLATNTKALIENRANILFAQADAVSKRYVASLEQLLQGVETRRYETQSPLRKLWRRLRDIENSLTGGLLFIGLSSMLMSVVGHIFFTAMFDNWQFGPIFCVCANLLLNSSILATLLVILFYGILWYIGNTINQSSKSLEKVELGWNKLRGNFKTNPKLFQEPEDFKNLADVSNLTANNAAQIVLTRTDQQQDEDKSRQRWFRFISVFVGLGLAYSLQIDAAELLDTAVPGIENTLNSVLFISGAEIDKIIHWQWITPDRNLTAGILLTGFAAAAGSKFWHDRLGQLQAAKKSAETAAELVSQAKQVVASIEQENPS